MPRKDASVNFLAVDLKIYIAKCVKMMVYQTEL